MPIGRSARGVVSIASGAAAGQLVAALAAPLLTRLFTPAEYGTFAVVNATALCLVPLATGRLEVAIPAAENDDSASLQLQLALAFVASFFVGGILTVAAMSSADQFGPYAASALWVVLLATSVAVFQVYNQAALREQAYRAVAQRNFWQLTAATAAQLAFGYKGLGAGGLAGGAFAGQVIGALTLALRTRLRGIEPRRLRSIWNENLRLVLQLAPAGVANALGLFAVLFAVTHFYGASAGGQLGLAQRILAIPLLLIGQAVAGVYFAELSKSQREGRVPPLALFRKTSARLAMVSVAGAAILILAGPWSFPMLFGERWTESGRMAQALAPAIAAQFITAPIAQTLVVYRKFGSILLWDVARLATSVMSVAVAFRMNATAVTAVWIYAATAVVTYLCSWYMSHRAISRAYAEFHS